MKCTQAGLHRQYLHFNQQNVVLYNRAGVYSSNLQRLYDYTRKDHRIAVAKQFSEQNIIT
jgi:hypothetical protein